MRCFRPFLLGLFCVLSGCAAPLAVSPAISRSIEPEKEPTCSAEEIASLRPGTLVVVTESATSQGSNWTRGTVLKSGSEGVAMINCVRSTSVLAPGKSTGIFKMSGVEANHVPVQWVATRQIAKLTVLAPPPGDFVAPDVAIDMNNGKYYERIGIDFKFDQTDNPTVQMGITEVSGNQFALP